MQSAGAVCQDHAESWPEHETGWYGQHGVSVFVRVCVIVCVWDGISVCARITLCNCLF